MFLIIDITSELPTIATMPECKGAWVFCAEQDAVDTLQCGNRDSTGEYDIVELASTEGCVAISATVLEIKGQLHEANEGSAHYEKLLQILASVEELQAAWLHAYDARQQERSLKLHKELLIGPDGNHRTGSTAYSCGGVY